MKVFLSPSNQDRNYYAYGNVTEYEVCGDIATLCKDALIRNGIEVLLMHDENIATKVAKANAWGANLYVPIHSNAFNGTVSGTRMFYGSDNGYKACKSIYKYLAPLTPGTSESITQNKSLAEINSPKATTAYIEVDFHDVKSVAKWIIEHKKDIAEAIAHGICDYANITYKASEVNTPVKDTKPAESTESKSDVTIKVNDVVSIAINATYYNGDSIPSWVIKKQWVVKEVSGNRAVIDKSVDGINSICSPINVKFLKVVNSGSKSEVKSEKPYKVEVAIPRLNIRKGPGTNYDRTGMYTGIGVFTITEVKKGIGSNTGWGKLKSGAGWISLDYTKRV